MGFFVCLGRLNLEDFMSSVYSTQPIQQQNFHHLVMDIAWFGVALATTSRFLSIYAIRVGASPLHLNLLASLPALALLFGTLAGVQWRARYPDSVRAVFWPALGFRMMFLLPVLTPFLPRDYQAIWLVLSLTLPALPQGIASVIFMGLMREAVEDERLTALLSRRSFAMNMTLALSALAFGFWLEQAPFPTNYQLMFLVAFGASIISAWYVNRVYTQPIAFSPRRKDGTNPWRDRNFHSVAMTTAITHVSFFIAFPMTTLWLMDYLGASEGFVAFFGLVELLAAAGASAIMPRFVGRFGNRKLIAAGMFGTALGMLVIALATSLPITLISAAILGASWASVGVGLLGYFAQQTPINETTRYATAFMQVLHLSIALGPLVGNLLFELNQNVLFVLLLGSSLRLIGGVLVSGDSTWYQRISRRSLKT